MHNFKPIETASSIVPVWQSIQITIQFKLIITVNVKSIKMTDMPLLFKNLDYNLRFLLKISFKSDT